MREQPCIVPAGAETISIGAFNRRVGPLYRLPDLPDAALRRYAFTVEDKHMNAAGAVHGGMLMSFADTAMGHAARLAAGAKAVLTISLNCDFMAPGRLGDVIEAHIRISRITRTTVFASADFLAEDRLLMTATGLWKIARAT